MSLKHKPRIIPVLDVMNGQVVRAVGGRRDEYQPIVSKLTASTKPVEVAKALIAATGAEELYVADLDAIRHGTGLSMAGRELPNQVDASVWVDAGIGRTGILDLPETPRLCPVVGFETCHVPEIFLETILASSQRPVVFSLDLKDGRLLGDWRAWGLKTEREAFPLAQRVIEMGARSLIVLDLARVGTGSGTGTESLLRAIRYEFPNVDLIAGGGVRNWDDIERLGEAGASGVLVASALHDGMIAFPRG